jgi:hypothetical protein
MHHFDWLSDLFALALNPTIRRKKTFATTISAIYIGDEIQREITRYRVRTTPDTFVSQPSPDVSKRAQKFGKSRSVYNNELSSLSTGWGGRVLSQSADRKKHLKTLLLLMRRAAV